MNYDISQKIATTWKENATGIQKKKQKNDLGSRRKL